MDFLNLASIRMNNKPSIVIKEVNAKDIAIVGIAGQMPMADNLDIYWNNIVNKIECIRDFPKSRRKQVEKYLRFKGLSNDEFKYYCAGFLDNIDEFDAKMFHLSPNEAKLMDPKQRIFLENAIRVIEDAGYNVNELKGKRVGIYSGFSDFGDETYFDVLSKVDPSLIEVGVSGNFQAIIPSRVSYMLDLIGPSMVIDTACSSSLIAIHLACQAIKNKECDSAIVGSVRIHMFPMAADYRIGFESLDGRTKAFDDNATGTGVGEGAITIMLKPLYKANEDGDHIYAVIKGSASNQDGNSVGITAPNADSQADVIERAWKDAGVDAEDISYIETHGTGTVLGDPIEIDGICQAFSKHTMRKQFCGIGSVKNNVGHLYEVSGLASVIKCIYALNKKVLPPTINFEYPNKAIDFENSPVYLNNELRDWYTDGKKRICGISSFGLSGTNCHIVLEEPETQDERIAGSSVLMLSGKSKDALRQLINSYIEKFEDIKVQNPKDVAYTALIGREHYDYRVAIVFSDYSELEKSLKELDKSSFDYIENKNIYYGKVCSNSGNIDISKLVEADLNTDLNVEILALAAKAYVTNTNVNWKEMFSSEKRKRAKLPFRVFDNSSYWIDIPDALVQQKGSSIVRNQTFAYPEATLTGKKSNAYTNTERKLSAVVKKVFGYDLVNIYDNFYELGGDSILVTKFHTEINKYFNINISIANIFTFPTIAKLAECIDDTLDINNIKTKLIEDKTIDGDDEIAIIGVAGRFPLADNANEYWENICNKKDCISSIPYNRKDDLKYYLRQIGYDEKKVEFVKAGYISEIDKFDYEYFGISLKEATLMNPNQRMFLEIVFELLENAGYGGERLKGSNTGVFVGYTDDFIYNYRRFIYDSDSSLVKTALAGNLNSVIAGRISYTLDLKGPSIIVDTACSSSLVAVNTAIKSLKNGECDTAIVGGVNYKLIPLYEPESNVGIESENYQIRAFDDDANGTTEGESICAIMLKPLKKAIADGDNIRAVIKGSAVNQDGTGMGIMAPRAETQSQVVIDAWKDAKIDPTTISYVETHGTGTKLGDPVEIDGLKRAFEMYTDKKQFCAIGSVKSNIGHLYQASGLASLIKCIYSLEKRKLVPTIHFDRPNRLIDFENSPFYINDILRDWKESETPRRLGVSSFGLSGTNCHIVLEEYIKSKDTEGKEETYIFTISGKDENAIRNLIKRYYEFLIDKETINIRNLCYTVNIGRGHYNNRMALLVRNKDELLDKLSKLITTDWKQTQIDGVFYGDVVNKKVISENITQNEVLELCSLYVFGNDIDWKELYSNDECKIVELPTYPFKKSRCWFIPKVGRRGFIENSDEGVLNDYEILEKELQKELGETVAATVDNDDIPKSKVEAAVISAFKDVLEVNHVTLDDNFFSLGGHSLNATQLASKIYQSFGVLIPLSDVFLHPIVKDLSKHIESILADEEHDTVEQIPVLGESDYYDLSIMQEEIWLSTQVNDDSSSMNIATTCILYNFDIDILYQSLRAVIERHEVMRTRMVEINGTVKQFVDPIEKIMEAYYYSDISTSDNLDGTIKSIIQKEVLYEFDLTSESLIRIRVVKVSEQKHLFLFVIHHIIADWWSVNIIMNDLKKYYKAFALGEEPELTPLTIQYYDFAAWYKQRIDKSKSMMEKYWNDVLKGPLPLLEMYTDYKRPFVKTQEGQRIEVRYSKDIISKLKKYADDHKGTMFMTLLSGVYTLLYKYSGQNDIIVGTNTSGREHPQLQEQVGYYLNILPLRVKIHGEDNYEQLFEKVKDTTLGAFKHQDYPFLFMLNNKSIIRDSSRSPIFDAFVQLVIDPNREETVIAKDAFIEEIEYDSSESKYDLVFNFFEKREEIILQLDYSTNLFKKETVERMLKRLNKIFEEFSDNQQIMIDKLQIEEKQNVSSIKKIKRR